MRLAFSIILLFGGLFSPVATGAQPAAKIARIGYLGLNLAATPHLPGAFLQGLRDLGYAEGRNVVIEWRDAEGKLKVDVIVAGGQFHALAAKEATRTIPIVCASAPDPVESGLVTSLARPGGNVTGLTSVGLVFGENRKRLADLATKIRLPMMVFRR